MTEKTEAVTVVVADDQSAVREGLVLLLSTMPGVEVSARPGRRGRTIVAVAVRHPHVVLMDLRMPRVRRGRGDPAHPGESPAVQVVVLTTYADDDSIIAALRRARSAT